MKPNLDFRSDTVTTPTPEMREAMRDAVVGDDVFQDDPTVRQLEERAAGRLGHEAALFVASGTMGNQVCIKTHTAPGNEIILDPRSHIFNHEVGMAAGFSGVQGHQVDIWNPAQIEAAIRNEDIHHAETSLICIENSFGSFQGRPMPIALTEQIYDLGARSGVPVHMDGARIFNAAEALGVDVKKIAARADSVMFCLSKGLSAPVGSMVVGSRAFIKKARKVRKMMGGGMRQVGVLAAPGLIALEVMSCRLGEDHRNARLLAEGLGSLSQIEFSHDVETNILFFRLRNTAITIETLAGHLLELGIKTMPWENGQMRMVTHKDISSEDVTYAIEAFRDIFRRET
ncbi:MAG: GntG family PLP-dependent aldolase [Candidatus Latescibacterota bacterium]